MQKDTAGFDLTKQGTCTAQPCPADSSPAEAAPEEASTPTQYSVMFWVTLLLVACAAQSAAASENKLAFGRPAADFRGIEALGLPPFPGAAAVHAVRSDPPEQLEEIFLRRAVSSGHVEVLELYRVLDTLGWHCGSCVVRAAPCRGKEGLQEDFSLPDISFPL